jgi:hypothetical protein
MLSSAVLVSNTTLVLYWGFSNTELQEEALFARLKYTEKGFFRSRVVKTLVSKKLLKAEILVLDS